MSKLVSDGWATIRAGLDPSILKALRDSAFSSQSAGKRCLLDQPTVRETAKLLRAELMLSGILSGESVAIQAIAFDKTQAANWKVTWHQDLVFPFAKPVTKSDYQAPSIKEGVAYARPPREVLEALLAVRLHVDDCNETNGPLRVITGSHRDGILASAHIHRLVERSQPITCLVQTGEALLMKPLLLHASSPATLPGHRRVLHFVYYTGGSMTETWHRAIK